MNDLENEIVNKVKFGSQVQRGIVLSSFGGRLRQLARRETLELELAGGKLPEVGKDGSAAVEAASSPAELRLFDFIILNYR